MEPLALLLIAAGMDDSAQPARPVASAKTIDPAAFERLMRQHERLVLATAVRLLGNLEDAQDAAQEVFLKLHRNMAKVEAAGNLSGWLYRITVNVCHDQRRAKRDLVPAENAPELAAHEPDPQQLLTDAERRRALEMCLRRLPPKERAALVLRDLEGLTTEEVAAALASSEATVRSQISKARVKVKKLMAEYFRRAL